MFMFLICSAVILIWLVWFDLKSQAARRRRGDSEAGPFDKLL